MASKPTSDAARWREQAAFMREVGAVHAEWAWIRFDEVDQLVLTRLALGPPPGNPHVTAPSSVPPRSAVAHERASEGVAKRLLHMHETQFAASRFKPQFRTPETADTDVPRAVRTKRDASRGTKKVPKRGS